MTEPEYALLKAGGTKNVQKLNGAVQSAKEREMGRYLDLLRHCLWTFTSR